MTKETAGGLGLIALLGTLTAFGPLSIDMYLPGLPAIAHEFGTSAAHAQQSLSSFFLGLAVGQLIYGPFSDRFGRRPVLITGTSIYIVASLACLLSPSIGGLIGARLVQGLGGAAGPVMARAIVRDLYSGRNAARVQSFVIMVMAVAPLIAPLVGGYVVSGVGWRSIFGILLAFGVLCFGLVLFVLPETHDPAKRAGARIARKFAAYGRVLTNRYAVAYLLCGGMTFGSLFAYISGSPFVYIQVFGVQAQHFGYYFGINVLGLVIGNYINGRFVLRHGVHRMLFGGTTLAMIAALGLLTVSLLNIGGLWGVAIPLFFTTSVIGLVGSNTIAGLLEIFAENAGAASALFGVFQFGCGALAGAAVGLLQHGNAVAMATVMAGGTVGAFLAQLYLWLREPRGHSSPGQDQATAEA